MEVKLNAATSRSLTLPVPLGGDPVCITTQLDLHTDVSDASMTVSHDGRVSEGDGYDVNYLFGQVEIKEPPLRALSAMHPKKETRTRKSNQQSSQM